MDWWNLDSFKLQYQALQDRQDRLSSSPHRETASPVRATAECSDVLQGLAKMRLNERPTYGDSAQLAPRRDDVFHDMRAHNVHVRRADSPAPQWITEHQTVPESATLHDQRQAPDDRPSTSAGRRGVLAQVGGAIRRATGSGSRAPYPADKEMIELFVSGAEIGGSNFRSARTYAALLIRFSAWLRQHGKSGLRDRLFDEELTREVLQFQQKIKHTDVAAALEHLRAAESNRHGVVRIPGYHVIPDTDEWLISKAFPDTHRYRSELRAFSEWLHEEGREGLCDADRLHSETLMNEAQAYASTHMESPNLVAALKQLRIFDLTGMTAIRDKRDNRGIPEADRLLSEEFKNALLAAGGGRTYANGQTYADSVSARVRQFSAWLQEKGKGSLASRLHDPAVDVDLDLWTHGKNPAYGRTMRSMLKQVRATFPPNAPLPFLGAGTEPSDSSYSSMFPATPPGGWPEASQGSWNPDTPAASSYSSMFPPTPPGGWPEAPQSSWNPDTPGASSYSSMFPPTPSGGWPQASQGDWNPDTPVGEVTGPTWSVQSEASSSTFGDLESLGSWPRNHGREFDWGTPQQEVTGPRRNADVAHTAIPTFGEDETGRNWSHGAQIAPEWLLNRGVYDQQIVRIRDLEYRVVAMPGISNAWGQPQLFLYPHLRGG
ncbi:hypothetical protein AVKW3434_02990 [Acidovorax sp. SUPP3434]|uniref:hypothetical protein n=1 Tax=Acidovorax sp. SUPP3434 TaxID=2920880 RepID=UPI0023DE63BF|nr:hypothetical protein [Acidovorax sp. SUPP3434]GKS98308.1 hypothetical protein AVKW3434_02990 [Acidovorax sp. SUPP3434]